MQMINFLMVINEKYIVDFMYFVIFEIKTPGGHWKFGLLTHQNTECPEIQCLKSLCRF